MKPPGISSEFCKSEILVHCNCPFIVSYNIQFQLYISGFSGTFYACPCKSFPKSQPPVFLQNAYPKLGAMSDLMLCPDCLDPCCSNDLAIHNGNDFYSIWTVRLLLQKLSLLLRIKAVFIRI